MKQKQSNEDFITRDELENAYNYQKRVFDSKFDEMAKIVDRIQDCFSLRFGEELGNNRYDQELEEIKNTIRQVQAQNYKELEDIEKRLDNKLNGKINEVEIKNNLSINKQNEQTRDIFKDEISKVYGHVNDKMLEEERIIRKLKEESLEEIRTNVDYIEKQASQMKEHTEQYSQKIKEEIQNIAKETKGKSLVVKQEKIKDEIKGNKIEIKNLIDEKEIKLKTDLNELKQITDNLKEDLLYIQKENYNNVEKNNTKIKEMNKNIEKLSESKEYIEDINNIKKEIDDVKEELLYIQRENYNGIEKNKSNIESLSKNIKELSETKKYINSINELKKELDNINENEESLEQIVNNIYKEQLYKNNKIDKIITRFNSSFQEQINEVKTEIEGIDSKAIIKKMQDVEEQLEEAKRNNEETKIKNEEIENQLQAVLNVVVSLEDKFNKGGFETLANDVGKILDKNIKMIQTKYEKIYENRFKEFENYLKKQETAVRNKVRAEKKLIESINNNFSNRDKRILSNIGEVRLSDNYDNIVTISGMEVDENKPSNIYKEIEDINIKEAAENTIFLDEKQEHLQGIVDRIKNKNKEINSKLKSKKSPKNQLLFNFEDEDM